MPTGRIVMLPPWLLLWLTSNALQVLLRSSSIQARTIRTSVLHEVNDLQKTSRLINAWTVHLTKGISSEVETDADQLTDYGIPIGLQAKLAELRTDLDRFSDAEAFALMLSGYRMTDHALPEDDSPFPVSSERDGTWPFIQLADIIDQPRSAKYADLLRHLDLGQHTTLRPVRRHLPSYNTRDQI